MQKATYFTAVKHNNVMVLTHVDAYTLDEANRLAKLRVENTPADKLKWVIEGKVMTTDVD
jgi:hypothetical protein